MAAGIQVFNPDGSLQFDVGSRTARILTVAMVGGQVSGSVTNSGLSNGDALVGVINSDEDKVTPIITRSGNTVSWDYSSIPAESRDIGASMILMVY